MALQHHFVVVVEDGKAWIDYDVSINFDSGSIWDTEDEDWLDFSNLTDTQQEENEEASELIATILEMHNNPRL
jgi:hypothetical protein